MKAGEASLATLPQMARAASDGGSCLVNRPMPVRIRPSALPEREAPLECDGRHATLRRSRSRFDSWQGQCIAPPASVAEGTAVFEAARPGSTPGRGIDVLGVCRNRTRPCEGRGPGSTPGEDMTHRGFRGRAGGDTTEGDSTSDGADSAICSRGANSHQRRAVRSSPSPPGEGGPQGRMRGPRPHGASSIRREADPERRPLIRPFGAPSPAGRR